MGKCKGAEINDQRLVSDFEGSIAQIIISDNLDEITMAKGNCITRPDILVIHENEKVHLVCEEILPDAKPHATVSAVSNDLNEEELGRFWFDMSRPIHEKHSPLNRVRKIRHCWIRSLSN